MGKVYLGNQEISPAVSVPVAKEKFGASIDSFIGDVNENGVLGGATKPTSLVFDGVKDIADSACQNMFYGKANITDVSFPELTTISYTYACKSMFDSCSELTNISFPALTTLSGSYACYNMFSSCSKLTDISFPALTTISVGSCAYMFAYCSNLTSVSFPALTTISGENACSTMFAYCSNLTSVSFPALTTISGSNACLSMFSSCYKLTNISFPALTVVNSKAFGPNYNYIFRSCDALTEIHFRADAQAVIEAVTGYSDKWGAKNATIYFDL